jgi:hypothetical protein
MARTVTLEGVLPELMGLLVLRDGESEVAEQVAALLHRCDAVLVVDCGSVDATRTLASAAGARVLDLASPAGEGEALRAGLQLARELGYIGAMLPGVMLPSATDLDRLVLAHLGAPEAVIMGVGPAEAIAGKEWDEARALAEGLEAEPMPSFRPPRSPGLHGQVESWFERLVQTRYAYAWGGPRILPLQSILRRDLREPGGSIHIELLGLAAHAGVPTVEIEMSSPPPREVPTCRRAAGRLLGRFMALSLRASAMERLGMGGGYAPPTSSPLGLVLAASIAVALALGLSSCVKPTPVGSLGAGCAEQMPRSTWPGAGHPQRAFEELRANREALNAVWVEQGVVLEDPSFEGERRLRGVMAKIGPGRLRIRFLAGMGMTVFDYVQADGRWHLSVPSTGLSEGGAIGNSVSDAEALGLPGLPAAHIARLFLTPEPPEELGWQEGSCAVLEARAADGSVLRRFSYRRSEAGWEVAREELLGPAGSQLVARFDDYRSVGIHATWPYHQELEEPIRGTRVTLDTRSLRTEGLDPSLFAFPVADR